MFSLPKDFFRNLKSEVYYFNLILEIYKTRFYWFKYSPSAIFTFSINFSPRQKYKKNPKNRSNLSSIG